MASTPEEKYIEQAEPKVIRTQRVCMVLMGLVLPVFVVGYFSLFIPECEKLEVWFQRSGSVLVALGAIVEFNLLSINGDVNPSGASGKDHIAMSNKYKKLHSVLSLSAFIVIFFGTVIWSYGDLLYQNTWSG